MFIWNYSEEVITDATPEQIWAMWQDVSSWPCWDKELQWVRLNGNFTKGSTGRMKSVGGPEVDFTLSHVEPLRSFSDVAKLPLTTLVFDHEYITPPDENVPARIRHAVTMTGWLAPVFGYLIGSKIKNHLRDAMKELSRRALIDDKTIR
ncbi:conserved protein of unknown function [Xenorhabdus poinarii G6]|uniref:Polyketide cyclase n=1 Tax=Xenorhabdus poinarii G6 TaxID=1354304 RepID=A0A068R5J9_9GAMM|nr:SRPBCC family protein [Xenorhabdus poinarii]CDG22244.1 conserved protein of unknown function [Xenorhabdus poinarii G6]